MVTAELPSDPFGMKSESQKAQVHHVTRKIGVVQDVKFLMPAFFNHFR